MNSAEELALEIIRKTNAHIERTANGKLFCQVIRKVALDVLPLPENSRRYLESAHKGFLPHIPEDEQPKQLTWYHLRQARQDMTRDANQKLLSTCSKFNDQLSTSATALALALDELQYRNPTLRSRSLNGRQHKSWGYCYWCWRIIPDGTSTLKRKGKCDLHERGGAEYQHVRRALNRSKTGEECEGFSYSPRPLIPIMEEVEKQQNKIFHHIPKSIWQGMASGQFPPEDHHVTQVNIDLKSVWEAFPYTAQYVSQHGGNLDNPRSILETLQKYHLPEKHSESKPTDTHKKIESIFKYMEKDFALASKLLFWAEAWLRFMHEDKTNSPHGGKRKDAGRKILCT